MQAPETTTWQLCNIRYLTSSLSLPLQINTVILTQQQQLWEKKKKKNTEKQKKVNMGKKKK